MQEPKPEERNAPKKYDTLLLRIRNRFIAGLLVVIPIGGSIFILITVFNYVDNLIGPVVTLIWGKHIRGLGFVVMVGLVYLLGLIASNVMGRQILHFIESMLTKIPVFRQVYTIIRQLVNGFSLSQFGTAGFTQVVLVDFPRQGMKAIGFITNEITDKQGKKLFSVFVPTAPNPTSGFLQMLREEDMIRTEISVDDALKMVISAGSITPPSVGTVWPNNT